MTDKMREEFEAWYSKELGFREDNPDRMFSMFCDDGETHEYYRLSVRSAWLSWKASRTALRVELPKYYSTESIGLAYCADAVVDSLDAAGVSYK